MILSLIYGIFVSTTILSSTSIEQVQENSTNFIFILIYILLLIISILLNLNIVNLFVKMILHNIVMYFLLQYYLG